MRIFLSYPLTNQPFGGGNQFLKCLSEKIASRNLLTQDINNASVILTNSFFSSPIEDAYDKLFELKRAKPDLKFLHRMDGVLHVYRGNDETLWQDQISSLWAEICSDGVVFQSNYCQDIQYQHGYPRTIPSTIIGNACDTTIFHPPIKKEPSPNKCIRLIYTSWSSNILKGFPTLQMLDNTLNFNRYSFTFVGNSPVSFKNIRHIPAKTSAEVAELLRKADIFVGVSHHEPCSNAIGEALACGLPALIRNTGGNSSFVQQGAILYNNDEDIFIALEHIAANLGEYQSRLRPLDINDVTDKYIAFAEQLVAETPARRPDCHKFLILRKKLCQHYPELPKRRAWRCKLWLDGWTR